MPFKQAKNIVEKRIAPQVEEQKNFMMKLALQRLLIQLGDHIHKASEYIGHAKYKGHNKDKNNYLTQINDSTDEFLNNEDKSGEFLVYAKNLDKQSTQLHETIKEKIIKHEQEKYLKLCKEDSKLIEKGEFKEATQNLTKLKDELSPLNQTDKSGELNKRRLKLDKVIEERLLNLAQQSILYKALLKPDTVLMLNDKQGIVIEEFENGLVGFSEYENMKLGKNFKMDTKNGQKMLWQDFLKKYKIATFTAGKINFNKGTVKKIEIKEDLKINETLGEIAELKMLKEVNYIYSGGLDKLNEDPDYKKALEEALAENFNSMRLFFEKDENGIIKPTEVYAQLSQSEKTHKFIVLLNGYKPILDKLQIKYSIEKENDPKMRLFKEAEVAYRNKNYILAYGKFRKFVRDTYYGNDYEDQHYAAKERLKKCSMEMLKLGHAYLDSCLNEPEGNQSFYLGKKYKTHMIKKLKGWIGKLGKAINSGEARDLDWALENIDLPAAYKGHQGRTETNFTTFHFNKFLKKLAKAANKPTEHEQKEELLKLADKARKDKFFQGASVLYRTHMEQGIRKLAKENNKSSKEWELRRIKYLARIGKAPKFKKFTFDKKILEKRKAAEVDYADKLWIKTKTLEKAYLLAGGIKEFEKLPKEKKNEMIAKIKSRIVLKQINEETRNDNFLKYVKDNQVLDTAAFNYNDMADPFDETNNFSDKGWENVKQIIKDIPLDIMVMSASAGVGYLAGNLVRGANKVKFINAMLQSSKLSQYGLSGTAIASDLIFSEIADRKIRKYILGQDIPMELSSFLAHSIGMYGGMKYIAGGGQRLLTKAGMSARAASAASLFGFEAPWAMTISHIAGEGQGSFGEQYGMSLMNMLKARVSMSLLHKSTGGKLLKQEQDFHKKLAEYKDADWKLIPRFENVLLSGAPNVKFDSASDAKYRKAGFKEGDQVRIADQDTNLVDDGWVIVGVSEKNPNIILVTRNKGKDMGTIYGFSKQHITDLNDGPLKRGGETIVNNLLDIKDYKKEGFEVGDRVTIIKRSGLSVTEIEYTIIENPKADGTILIQRHNETTPKKIKLKDFLENRRGKIKKVNREEFAQHLREFEKEGLKEGDKVDLKFNYGSGFGNVVTVKIVKKPGPDGYLYYRDPKDFQDRRMKLSDFMNSKVSGKVMQTPEAKLMKVGLELYDEVRLDDILDTNWIICKIEPNGRILLTNIKGEKYGQYFYTDADSLIKTNKDGPLNYPKFRKINQRKAHEAVEYNKLLEKFNNKFGVGDLVNAEWYGYKTKRCVIASEPTPNDGGTVLLQDVDGRATREVKIADILKRNNSPIPETPREMFRRARIGKNSIISIKRSDGTVEKGWAVKGFDDTTGDAIMVCLDSKNPKYGHIRNTTIENIMSIKKNKLGHEFIISKEAIQEAQDHAQYSRLKFGWDDLIKLNNNEIWRIHGDDGKKILIEKDGKVISITKGKVLKNNPKGPFKKREEYDRDAWFKYRQTNHNRKRAHKNKEQPKRNIKIDTSGLTNNEIIRLDENTRIKTDKIALYKGMQLMNIKFEGITKDSLKRAYRKAALKYHPDRSKDPNAAETFKTISLANIIITKIKKFE